MFCQSENQQNKQNLANVQTFSKVQIKLNQKKNSHQQRQNIKQTFNPDEQKSNYSIFKDSIKIAKDEYALLQKKLKLALKAAQQQIQVEKPLMFLPSYGSNNYQNIEKKLLKVNQCRFEQTIHKIKTFQQSQQKIEVDEKDKVKSRCNQIEQQMDIQEQDQIFKQNWNQYLSDDD